MSNRGDVLYRLLQELRLGEITAIVRHFGFPADGDKEERLVRLRDHVLDGDIPIRDVLRSAYVWQLARMCQIAGLPSEGLRHELVNRLGDWYENAMAQRGRPSETEAAEPEIPNEDLAEAQVVPAHETLSTTSAEPAAAEGDGAPPRLRREIFEHLTQHFERDRHHVGLISLPPGSGRLRAALEWILSRHVALGRRVLWLAERVELLNQAQDEIRRQVGSLAGRRTELSLSRFDGLHARLDGDVVLATPAALLQRGIAGRDIELNGRLGLVCWDEVQPGSAARPLRALRAVWPAQVPLLGLGSAPPAAEAGTAKIIDLFGDKAVFKKTWRELVDAGVLAQPVFLHRRMHATEGEPLPLGPSDAERIRRQGSDVPTEVLAWIAKHTRRVGEVVAHWLNQRDRYGKTVFFACNLVHAEGLVESLRSHGVDADCLHPGLAEDARRRRLSRFRSGQGEVLVTTGLIAESEDVPEVKTVMLARPTTSQTFYLQMMARGARARAGKSRFFVVDCVDEFEKHGVILAGRDVAASLGETFAPADAAGPPAPARTPGEAERRRRDRALVSAQAWMLLRRLAPEQYTFWGELIWELPEGGEKSIAVFVEGLPALREGVERVARACEVGDWSGLHELGAELDKLGALRSVDWEDMMQAVGQVGKPPRLEWAPEMQLAASSDAAARDVATLVDALLSGRMSFTDVIGQCETLIAVNPELAERFGSAKVLRQEVMALSIDVGARQARVGRLRKKREDAAGERLHKLEAFVRFAMGVSRSDDNIHEAETRCITKAAARMFEIAGEEEWELLSKIVDRARTEPIDVDQLSLYLREHATQPERLAMYDWLFRIADADGLFVPEETSFLKLAGVKLGVPREEFEELLDRYGAGIPAAAAGAEELAVCPQCNETREVGAKFCVSCGYPFDLD